MTSLTFSLGNSCIDAKRLKCHGPVRRLAGAQARKQRRRQGFAAIRRLSLRPAAGSSELKCRLKMAR